MANAPWASGPGEILQHAISLLERDSDKNRRIAFILIDNAVELTLKTYLGLPRRITGIKVSRKELEQLREDFPTLLDTIEQVANEKIVGINLGEIEWYHRLRNELYHQGNGLTVERQKVEVYAELARLLFKALFGRDLPISSSSRESRRIGEFLDTWVEVERKLPEKGDWKDLRWSQAGEVRNRLVHGQHLSDHELAEAYKQVLELLRRLQSGGDDDASPAVPSNLT